MKKVQTGQVIEFYSNSCLVKTNFGKFKCLAIKNVVVGDFVDLEIIQDSKKLVGKILKINNRFSSLSKGYDDKEKLFVPRYVVTFAPLKYRACLLHPYTRFSRLYKQSDAD